METQYQHVRIKRVGKVAHLILDRPDILNAVHQAAIVEVEAASRALAADPELRLIAIRGAGRAFCTGIDLKALAADGIEFSYFRLWEDAMRRFETMDKLVLCLIHGYALGGGLQLALASDIRVCTPSAKLGLPAIKEGLIPGLGTFRLARYIGLGRAKQLIIRGNMIDGAEAERIGLVDHLVGEDTYESEFAVWVDEYAKTNSAGCRYSKQMLLECFDMGFDAFFAKYLDLQEKATADDDFTEAMEAYREDRPPVWQ